MVIELPPPAPVYGKTVKLGEFKHHAEEKSMPSSPAMTSPDAVMWHPFANMGRLAGKGVTIVRGEGSTVYDAAGRGYLGALASLW